MASLPSFVELLSSLGMSDRPAGTVDPKPIPTSDHVHDLRDASHSGRHVSPTMTKKARFSPYSSSQALAVSVHVIILPGMHSLCMCGQLSDRRGSLPALPLNNTLDSQASRVGLFFHNVQD